MQYTTTLSSVIDQNKIEQVFKHITRSNNIVITTHLSPDGDALGSSLALYHFLQRKGKNVKIIVPNSFPYFLKWMEGANKILVHESVSHEVQLAISEADLIFSLDYNTLKRIGQVAPLVEKAKAKKILIDHHLFPDTSFDVIVSYPPISSTCELIFRFFWQKGLYGEMSRTEAECIYCGMMTDTVTFTCNASNPEIYEIISLLLRKGVDKDTIYSNVNNNFTEDRFRLLGFTLSQRMKIYPELHSALIYLSIDDQSQFNLKKGDTEGFVNYPLNIKDIIFSTFIREDKELIKLSFRSQKTFPSNEFAAEFFNGGGHLNASGGEFYGKLEDAIERFENGLTKYSSLLKE